MSDPRTVVVTSATSGVGRAVLAAARTSAHQYRVIALSTTPERSSFDVSWMACAPTRHRRAFAADVLRAVPDLGQCLVVPGRDEDAVVLGEVYEELRERHAWLAAGPPAALHVAFDKALTAQTFGEGPLSFARTAVDERDAIDRLVESVGWPLLVKPRYGNASRDVRIVHSAADLHTEFRPGIDIIQEYLPLNECDARPWDGELGGGQDGEISVQLVVDRQGDLVASFASRNALGAGVPLLVEPMPGSDYAGFVDPACRALRAIGAFGAWNFQGRRDANGLLRVFEVNARPTGLTGLRARLGFNEVDMLYDAIVLDRRGAAAVAAIEPVLVDLREGERVPLGSTSDR